MTPLRRPVLVASAAALVAVALPGPAHAERVTVNDARGDVVTGEGSLVPRGDDGESSTDLVTATLVHTARQVRLIARVRDLRSSDRAATPNAVFYLEVSGGGAFLVRRTGGRPAAELVEMTSDEWVDCRVAARRTPATDRIAYAFDRSCLDDPRWLRFGAYTANDSADHRFGLVDDARREVSTGDGAAVVGGRPIYAGRRDAATR